MPSRRSFDRGACERRDALFGPESSRRKEGTCETVLPLNTCGVAAVDSEAMGTLYCEATSDQGAKKLRATLVNEGTGGSSDAR